MAAPVAPEGLMAAVASNFLFRTFVAGAGFFADSYDLFITDGVGNLLKNLGPVNAVAGSLTPSRAPSTCRRRATTRAASRPRPSLLPAATPRAQPGIRGPCR